MLGGNLMKHTKLLTIKEFSSLTGVKESKLRYYDDIGLLPPMSRGDNNYRYYTACQSITLNFINILVNLGVPLSTIKNITESRSTENLIELLNEQEKKLNCQIQKIGNAFSVIHSFRNNIKNSVLPHENYIKIEEQPETRLIFGQEHGTKTKYTFCDLFIRFFSSAQEHRINLDFPIGGYYNNIHSFLDTPNQPDRFFSLDPSGNILCKAGKYLVGYNRGCYGEFGNIPAKIIDYADNNDFIIKEWEDEV